MAGRRSQSLANGVIGLTAASFLVPVVGLVTAPILARALSPDGRGQLAASMAPAVLMASVATLGLPEALTFRLARRPRDTGQAIAVASAMTIGLGLLTTAIIFAALPYLAAGDSTVAHLILLAAAISIPGLLINALRGAATGHQLWSALALERVGVTLWRLVLYVVLFATGHLTVLTALLVPLTAPVVAALVYVPMLRQHDPTSDSADRESNPAVARSLLAFGSRSWFGSVAEMLIARTPGLLLLPLSTARDLGLYSVASTVSDLPLITAFAIQGALFGASSRTQDAHRLVSIARIMLLLTTVGCLVLGASLPLLIPPLFGGEFSDAVVPTAVLLASAVVSIPGLMAASGLSGWGRPGVRSMGLFATFLLDVVAFYALVPILGVLGACLAGLICNMFMSVFMVAWASRVMQIRGRDFWLVRGRDVAVLWQKATALSRRLPLFSR